MNRIISAIAVLGVGLIAYRSVPVLWALHPLDGFVVGCALLAFGIRYLIEALTGSNTQ